MSDHVHCSNCGLGVVNLPGRLTTGYGQDADGNKYCFACCGERDRASMEAGKPITLYLIHESGHIGRIANWPDTLGFVPVRRCTVGRHNIARTRYDVWFNFAGRSWHGVQYGENTQLCHCRPVKSR